MLSLSYFPQASEILRSTFVAHHGRINFDPCTQRNDFAHLLLVFLTTGSGLNVGLLLLLESDSYANELNSHGLLSPVSYILRPKNSPPCCFLFVFVSHVLASFHFFLRGHDLPQ